MGKVYDHNRGLISPALMPQAQLTDPKLAAQHLRALSQSNHSLYWKKNEELGKDYFYWVYGRETNKTWQVPGLLTVSLQSHI